MRVLRRNWHQIQTAHARDEHDYPDSQQQAPQPGRENSDQFATPLRDFRALASQARRLVPFEGEKSLDPPNVWRPANLALPPYPRLLAEPRGILSLRHLCRPELFLVTDLRTPHPQCPRDLLVYSPSSAIS